MTTRLAWRDLLRAELHDAGQVRLWSDALLNEWLNEAIRDYSARAPKETSTSPAGVAHQADYTLPADCLKVVRVEHPTDFFRIEDPLSMGDYVDPFLVSQGLPRAISEQLSYEVYGPHGARVLSLRPAPTDTTVIKIRYLAAWGEPAADATALLTPALDDHLLLWFAASKALQWLGTDESKRQRWERQRGVSAVAAMSQYDRDYLRFWERRASRVESKRLVVRG